MTHLDPFQGVNQTGHWGANGGALHHAQFVGLEKVVQCWGHARCPGSYADANPQSGMGT